MNRFRYTAAYVWITQNQVKRLNLCVHVHYFRQVQIDPEAFFAFIDRFLKGTNDAEVARECGQLVRSLPKCAAPTCLLIGMVTHKRIGDFENARKFALALDRIASGWDLPGIPTNRINRLQQLAKFEGQIDASRLVWAIFEEEDVTSILEILRELQVDAKMLEANALLSLISQYEARRQQLQK